MNATTDKFGSSQFEHKTEHPQLQDEVNWQTLFRVGRIAALMVVILIVAEVIAWMIYPQPDNIEEWFVLFQSNPLIGLVDFWGLELPMYVMFALVFLALYVVLVKTNPSVITIALVCILIGTAILISTNNPFTMLNLSNRYAITTTESEQSMLLAAGEMILVNTNQRAVGGFNAGLFLVSVAGLLVSLVMLETPIFNRTIAYTGIAAYSLSLVDYLRQMMTQSEIIALSIILPNAILLIIWFFFVSRSLNQLATDADS
ncbi:MAG: DUF4386 family protein [Chloroflexota bacterium]